MLKAECLSELTGEKLYVLKGAQANNLSHYDQLSLAKQAAQMLVDLGGEHMFHPDHTTIQRFMQAELTVIVTDANGAELIGFAKIDPWLKVHEEYPMVLIPVGIEIGSLVVARHHQNKGIGKYCVREAAGLAGNIFPDVPRIAVVTNDNTPSLAVFNRLRWGIVGPSQCQAFLQGVNVLEGWEPPSTIFVDSLSVSSQHTDLLYGKNH